MRAWVVHFSVLPTGFIHNSRCDDNCFEHRLRRADFGGLIYGEPFLESSMFDLNLFGGIDFKSKSSTFLNIESFSQNRCVNASR